VTSFTATFAKVIYGDTYQNQVMVYFETFDTLNLICYCFQFFPSISEPVVISRLLVQLLIYLLEILVIDRRLFSVIHLAVCGFDALFGREPIIKYVFLNCYPHCVYWQGDVAIVELV